MTAIRILHVDDEPDIREVVVLSRDDPDFTVQSCCSGREALAIAAEWEPVQGVCDLTDRALDDLIVQTGITGLGVARSRGSFGKLSDGVVIPERPLTAH